MTKANWSCRPWSSPRGLYVLEKGQHGTLLTAQNDPRSGADGGRRALVS